MAITDEVKCVYCGKSCTTEPLYRVRPAIKDRKEGKLPDYACEKCCKKHHIPINRSLVISNK